MSVSIPAASVFIIHVGEVSRVMAGNIIASPVGKENNCMCDLFQGIIMSRVAPLGHVYMILIMLLVIGSKLFPWNGDVGRMWRSGRGIAMVGIGSQAGRSYLLVMGVGTIPMSVRVYWVLTLNGTSLFILLIF
jgi:hypothetical protein